LGQELFDVVQRRPDVLAGTLLEALFAATLDDVLAATTASTHRNRIEIFAASHQCAGLCSLREEVLGRIGGGISAAGATPGTGTLSAGGPDPRREGPWVACDAAAMIDPRRP
jgi:hypothetical protein